MVIRYWFFTLSQTSMSFVHIFWIYCKKIMQSLFLVILVELSGIVHPFIIWFSGTEWKLFLMWVLGICSNSPMLSRRSEVLGVGIKFALDRLLNHINKIIDLSYSYFKFDMEQQLQLSFIFFLILLFSYAVAKCWTYFHPSHILLYVLLTYLWYLSFFNSL